MKQMRDKLEAIVELSNPTEDEIVAVANGSPT
jgi:hypothetical protein